MPNVPGYDFSINEIPTVEKFRQQALGLRVDASRVADTNVASDMRIHVYGDTSGNSGGSLAGMNNGDIWTAPAGDIMVQTPRAVVKLWKAEGGYETNRWNYDATDGIAKPGYGMGGGQQDNATEADFALRSNPVQVDGTGRYAIFAATTGESGPLRMHVGGGYVGLQPTAPVVQYTHMRDFGISDLLTDDVPATWYEHVAGHPADPVQLGVSTGETPETSTTSQAGGNHHLRNSIYGWMFGNMWHET